MKKNRVEPRGLGDSVANLTFVKGVSKLLKKAGIEDCGCEKRQEQLNKLFPYKNKTDG